MKSALHEFDFQKFISAYHIGDYSVLLGSIRGVSAEIKTRRDYVLSTKSHVKKGNYYPHMIAKALVYNKELQKLKVIRNELWIIILQKEIGELL